MTITTRTTDFLRIGAASVVITPPAGIAMQGYELRYADGISDALLASALAVGSDRVEWLLLSVDTIGLDRGFTNRVRESLAERLLLPPSAVTIACSHTHSGPATLPHLGAVPCDLHYLAFLEQRLTAVAETAAKNLQSARWRFGVTSFTENVNRRLFKGGRIELESNPNGPVDSRLRVIRIDPATGSHQQVPLALVVHYACHATVSSEAPRISADWPGAMRMALQRVYAGDTVQPIVCFVQGCAGDLTHRTPYNPEMLPQQFNEMIGRLAAAAALCASERSINFPAESVQTVMQPLNLPFSDRSGSEETELQLVRIGPLPGRSDSARDSVWILGLPGEPFTTYSTELGRQFQRQLGAQYDNVLVCGYTNDCVGYLCTRKALREGGYESAVAHQIYHRPAPFSAATQKIVADCSLTAAKTLITETAIRQPSNSSPRLSLLGRWLSLLH